MHSHLKPNWSLNLKHVSCSICQRPVTQRKTFEVLPVLGGPKKAHNTALDTS